MTSVFVLFGFGVVLSWVSQAFAKGNDYDEKSISILSNVLSIFCWIATIVLAGNHAVEKFTQSKKPFCVERELKRWDGDFTEKRCYLAVEQK